MPLCATWRPAAPVCRAICTSCGMKRLGRCRWLISALALATRPSRIGSCISTARRSRPRIVRNASISHDEYLHGGSDSVPTPRSSSVLTPSTGICGSGPPRSWSVRPRRCAKSTARSVAYINESDAVSAATETVAIHSGGSTTPKASATARIVATTSVVDDPHPHPSGTLLPMRRTPPHPVRPRASRVRRAAACARRRSAGSTVSGPARSGRNCTCVP